LRCFAASRGRISAQHRRGEGAIEIHRLLPRIGIGVSAPALSPKAAEGPMASCSARNRPDRLFATLGGALTPWRAGWSAFPSGRRAHKSGAGAPQVIAYSTAWGALCDPPAGDVGGTADAAAYRLLRALVSLPLPFMAAALAMLAERREACF